MKIKYIFLLLTSILLLVLTACKYNKTSLNGETISGKDNDLMNIENGNKAIYLAGGCFWGVDEYFSRIEGVLETEVGYANGKTENPTYKQVCTGITGHTETTLIKYDENIVSLRELLDKFFIGILGLKHFCKIRRF